MKSSVWFFIFSVFSVTVLFTENCIIYITYEKKCLLRVFSVFSVMGLSLYGKLYNLYQLWKVVLVRIYSGFSNWPVRSLPLLLLWIFTKIINWITLTSNTTFKWKFRFELLLLELSISSSRSLFYPLRCPLAPLLFSASSYISDFSLFFSEALSVCFPYLSSGTLY